MNLIEYPDRELMMLALADKVASQLRRALEVEDRVTLCVPGGTTPGPVFDILSGLDLDWARVWVLLNDERWVDETSPRSNTALLRNRLLRGAAALAHLVPLYAPAETPEDRLDELSRGVRAALPLTVLLLGMGADMHTASLFPGADRLAEALAPDAPPVMALRADAAGEPRITLTAPVLRAAMHCHLLITGAEKRAALERAARLPETEAPVRIVLSNATIHWAP
ncbi:6-phosphogluconolactonase [Rhodobacter capsulatus]|uniref:6-phosphogluconolactonase n=1 Tax=Rhodobacter capsulatus TaxID=1061 RepID=UPI0006DC7030|nr:6-phosphogluconolactonase [Rhodobacter capsulatus]KQB14097.1 6-phosphogluconolactonase [Rhodobacter capsulatus]KQB15765.1 6-phosphogluconolactonase [Rhodobacter capsulatus]PZX26415.1 6-phosphogluconolactonase [Rhodobacter capsulatus]QNR61903.1 6-phosphogluconolactonase [Rhodobacter capsulatus]